MKTTWRKLTIVELSVTVATLIGAGAILAAGAVYRNLTWIESHPGTAAWVQAIFSIVGIFVAIAVPSAIWFVESHRRKLDRHERSENLVHSLIGDVMPFWSQIALMRVQLHNGSHGPPRDEDEWFRWFGSMTLQIPKAFEDAMALTHDMERNLIDPLRDLCNSAKTHNAYALMLRGDSRENGISDWSAIRARVEISLELVAFCATESMALYAKGSDQLKHMITSSGLADVKKPEDENEAVSPSATAA